MRLTRFAPIYLLHRFFAGVADFFRRWYAGGTKDIGRAFLTLIRRIDRAYVIWGTLRNFFTYRDVAALAGLLAGGRKMSWGERIAWFVILRLRVILGIVVALAATLLFLMIAIVWVAIPFAILWYIWSSYREQ